MQSGNLAASNGYLNLGIPLVSLSLYKLKKVILAGQNGFEGLLGCHAAHVHNGIDAAQHLVHRRCVSQVGNAPSNAGATRAPGCRWHR